MLPAWPARACVAACVLHASALVAQTHPKRPCLIGEAQVAERKVWYHWLLLQFCRSYLQGFLKPIDTVKPYPWTEFGAGPEVFKHY